MWVTTGLIVETLHRVVVMVVMVGDIKMLAALVIMKTRGILFVYIIFTHVAST